VPHGAARLTAALAPPAEEADRLLAQRMRIVADLHCVYAHDLRAPLNSMQLSLELLAATLSDPGAAPGWERHLAVMREELARLNRLIESTLERGERAGAERGFDLREALDEIGRVLKARARRIEVTVELELPQAPVRVAGFRERVEQALLDIVAALLDATPRAGKIALRAQALDDRVEIRIEGNAPAGAPDGPRVQLAGRVLECHGGILRTGAGETAAFIAGLPRV
jgi:signal transduction histidine kinase